jgi:hypothetical protein
MKLYVFHIFTSFKTQQPLSNNVKFFLKILQNVDDYVCVSVLYRQLLNYRKKTHPNFFQFFPKSGASLGSIIPSSNSQSTLSSPVGHTGTRRCYHLHSSWFLSKGRFPTDEPGQILLQVQRLFTLTSQYTARYQV